MGPECRFAIWRQSELAGASQIGIRLRIVHGQPHYQRVVRTRIQTGLRRRGPGIDIAFQINVQARGFRFALRLNYCQRERLPRLSADVHYLARMIANALAIAVREAHREGDGTAGESLLTRELRSGRCDEERWQDLQQITRRKLEIINPKVLAAYLDLFGQGKGALRHDAPCDASRRCEAPATDEFLEQAGGPDRLRSGLGSTHGGGHRQLATRPLMIGKISR